MAYPELAGIEDDQLTAATQSNRSASQEMDEMLEEAKIGPELIESLGTGFRNLADHTAQLNNISDASVATNEFVGNIKDASNKMSGLSESYEKASETLTGLSVSSEDSNAYADSLKGISAKLSELNNVYELQLKSASEHMQTSNEAFEGMSNLMSNLQSSVSSTEQYKENISELANNLSSLNTIYGNMLNARNAGGVNPQS